MGTGRSWKTTAVIMSSAKYLKCFRLIDSHSAHVFEHTAFRETTGIQDISLPVSLITAKYPGWNVVGFTDKIIHEQQVCQRNKDSNQRSCIYVEKLWVDGWVYAAAQIRKGACSQPFKANRSETWAAAIKVLRDDVMIASDYMVMINSARTITNVGERKKINPASRGKCLTCGSGRPGSKTQMCKFKETRPKHKSEFQIS